MNFLSCACYVISLCVILRIGNSSSEKIGSVKGIRALTKEIRRLANIIKNIDISKKMIDNYSTTTAITKPFTPTPLQNKICYHLRVIPGNAHVRSCGTLRSICRNSADSFNISISKIDIATERELYNDSQGPPHITRFNTETKESCSRLKNLYSSFKDYIICKFNDVSCDEINLNKHDINHYH